MSRIISEMTCDAVEKRIPQYLANTLSEDELYEFLTHIQNCPSCKEELTIQYLVRVGLDAAEEDNYDLLNSLDKEIREKMKKIQLRRSVKGGLGFCVAILILCALAAVALLMV